ncbi:MAG: peptide chain release factor 2 [Candidatus Cloacimonadota bacterium]|nr:peptide chain release factor 2 [Candidatus Cloacimonadota bacterium]
MDLNLFSKEVEEIQNRIFELQRYLEGEKKKDEIDRLEKEITKPNFWDDQENAKRISEKISDLKEEIGISEKITNAYEELETYLNILKEEYDTELAAEAENKLSNIRKFIDKLELQLLLNGATDKNDAILVIHPGAGGTESHDWAKMLFRMYLRWVEMRNYKVEILDKQPGDEAGIKSATLEIKGKYAYGYLKSETGVHRLVRISPFDSNKRRHTSFASVFVYPEVEDSIEVETKEADLRIDTFRSSGAGGQHVNKVSSAVRITHIPTGIVSQCQSERSQFQNKENAMKVLKARLYQYYKEKKDAKKQKLESKKKKIEWGSQIRSYVFQPYSMVKDHRTNVQTGNVQAVMDGNIDLFINAFLKMK